MVTPSSPDTWLARSVIDACTAGSFTPASALKARWPSRRLAFCGELCLSRSSAVCESVPERLNDCEYPLPTRLLRDVRPMRATTHRMRTSHLLR